MSEQTDTERTDDAAFTGVAADRLRDATERQTREVASEEDGSAPDEPQPDADDDADDEPTAPAPEPIVTTSDDPPAA